jgi:hypothetical protein
MITKADLISQANAASQEYKAQVNRLVAELDYQKEMIRKLIQNRSIQFANLVDTLCLDLPANVDLISKQIGCAYLPSQRDMLLTEIETWKTKVKEIESIKDFENADFLINPFSGTLTTERNSLIDKHMVIKVQLQRYENSNWFPKLRSILDKGGINPTRSWFIYFWNFVTLKTEGYNKLVAKVLEDFDFSSITDMLSSINKAKNDEETLREAHESLTMQIYRIIRLVEIHNDYTEKIASSDQYLAEKLKARIMLFLNSIDDFSMIRNNLGQEYHIILSTLTAISQQIDLIRKSTDGLNAEILNREKSQNEVNQMLIKLKKTHHKGFDDKYSTWLNQGTTSSSVRANRYINGSRAYCTSVYEFNDYQGFDTQLIEGYVLMDMIFGSQLRSETDPNSEESLPDSDSDFSFATADQSWMEPETSFIEPEFSFDQMLSGISEPARSDSGYSSSYQSSHNDNDTQNNYEPSCTPSYYDSSPSNNDTSYSSDSSSSSGD